jgi:hypothetical protein
MSRKKRSLALDYGRAETDTQESFDQETEGFADDTPKEGTDVPVGAEAILEGDGERTVELDAAGATALLQGAPGTTELPDIELPTAHHFAITRIAIENRAEALKKLADKTADEGYVRESRVILADSQALTEDVLPQFRDQAELPLVTYESVKYGIADLLRGNVWKHVQQSADDQVDHRNNLLDVVSSKMAQLALAIAERAYNAGFRAREETPEVFAVKSLAEIRG